VILLATLLATFTCNAGPWPHWTRYVETFVSPDGRVIDRTSNDRTTSEGQSYALFFAVVANDRALFDKLLSWTEENLAQGDLGKQLPSWTWGKRKDGSWGVQDGNAASDADLWIAYALLEGGRLWNEPRYTQLARALLTNVVRREVIELPGLGPMLLPGPAGFAVEKGRAFRLNPSYLPPQLLRRFASARMPGPWPAVLESTTRMLRETAPKGAVADWVLYRARRGFAPDTLHGRTGSYDAIRTYLWIGMLPDGDPLRRELDANAGALLRALAETGRVPERIDVRSLRAEGHAPVGFAAALLPLARSRGDTQLALALEDRIAGASRNDLFGDPPTYYDQNLVLFGRGFVEGRYRFGTDGGLIPAWGTSCQSAQ
jgi:endoglucanase